MFGLTKDLVGFLNQSSLKILTFRLIDHMNLPVELKSPRKVLLNIKNKDQKCFLWCHVRHINPSKEHPGRI